MGTPEFAVQSLTDLVRSGYPVIGVVTQPDRPKGRGRAIVPSPVKILADHLGLTVFQPDKVRNPSFLLTFRELAPDLVIVAAFGQILPKEIILTPKWGCINIHPSLLPKYRGAAPINWALIRGEQKTGVSIMRMDEGVDSGAILLQEETPIGPTETYGVLHDRLATMGAELLLIALAMLRANTLQPRPQDDRFATTAPRLTREDGLIRWENDHHSIVSLIRGLSPHPSAYTTIDGKQLKIFVASAEPAAGTEAPGTVCGDTAAELRVAAGNGYVLLEELQFEGKKRMTARDFLRGFHVAQGHVLGRQQGNVREKA
jgi:methionyl-tRNA formyltransferase